MVGEHTNAKLEKTEPKNAPAMNWPSIAMLTTPARSHRTPASAPKTSAVDSRMVPGIGFVMAGANEPLGSA